MKNNLKIDEIFFIIEQHNKFHYDEKNFDKIVELKRKLKKILENKSIYKKYIENQSNGYYDYLGDITKEYILKISQIDIKEIENEILETENKQHALRMQQNNSNAKF